MTEVVMLAKVKDRRELVDGVSPPPMLEGDGVIRVMT